MSFAQEQNDIGQDANILTIAHYDAWRLANGKSTRGLTLHDLVEWLGGMDVLLDAYLDRRVDENLRHFISLTVRDDTVCAHALLRIARKLEVTIDRINEKLGGLNP